MTNESTLSVRWWQLPACLGLDAPLVVVLWIAAFAKTFDKAVPTVVFGAAFLAVWAVYLLDRLIDIKTCCDWRLATPRLKFGRRFQSYFRFGFISVLSAGLVLLVSGKIPAPVSLRAAVVGVGVGAYFILFVLPPVFKNRKLPGKEFGVGLFFSGGIFSAIGFQSGKVLSAYLAAGIMAVLNCLVIASREVTEDHANDPGAAACWWQQIEGHVRIGVIAFTLITFVSATLQPDEYRFLFYTFAGSGFLLTALHWNSKKIQAENVRAFADFALIIPPSLFLVPEILKMF